MIVSLKDICEKIGSGATPEGGKLSYSSTGIALIRSQNVLDLEFSFDGLAHINSLQAKKLQNVEIKPNDVLLNITGDSVARSCIVDDKALPARVNQHVLIIRGKKNIVYSPYLLYFIHWRKKELLQLASAGATRKALTKEMIENFRLNLPPIEKQREIVKSLEAIDKKIKLNHLINDNLAA